MKDSDLGRHSTHSVAGGAGPPYRDLRGVSPSQPRVLLRFFPPRTMGGRGRARGGRHTRGGALPQAAEGQDGLLRAPARGSASSPPRVRTPSPRWGGAGARGARRGRGERDGGLTLRPRLLNPRPCPRPRAGGLPIAAIPVQGEEAGAAPRAQEEPKPVSTLPGTGDPDRRPGCQPLRGGGCWGAERRAGQAEPFKSTASFRGGGESVGATAPSAPPRTRLDGEFDWGGTPSTVQRGCPKVDSARTETSRRA